jgi:hypothetical protein
MPVVTAMYAGIFNVNEIYRKEVINGKEYYKYDDIKGEDVGIRAIYDGVLGILPTYRIETDTFRWPLIENMLGFGIVAIRAMLDIMIELIKLLGQAIFESIISLF